MQMKQAIKTLIRTLVERLPGRAKLALMSLLTTDNRIPPILAAALRASDARDYATAEQTLEKAISTAPMDSRFPPHLSRVRYLKARAASPAALAAATELQRSLAAMEAEIRLHSLYVPSEFWSSWGRFNDKLLADYGIENFKRTVSHNYQNWMMTSTNDSQVRRLHELWPKHRSHQPWLNAIEGPDHVGSPVDPRFTRPEYPLADARKREIYRVAVGLLWEYVLSTDSFGVLENLTELEVGNPLRIWRNGRLISSDIAHSVRERNILLGTLGLNGGEGLSVAELGAGHGRLAEIFGRTTNYRYFIFDITPALGVSQWYIKGIFPDERIFEFRHFESFSEIEGELRECRFAFFTPNQLELIPNDAFHLFINMNSLMEMRADQVRNFLNQIDRLTTRAFLSRQWLKWRNPDEGHSLAKEDFALSERWRVGLDQIDDIFPEFFNQVWQRVTQNASI
jgi:putative sugar O-methyltransferase